MRKKFNCRFTILLHLISVVFIFCGNSEILFAQKKGVKLNQMEIPYAHITDSSLIQFFLEEFFITEENVVAIDVVDISRNGFGQDDIIITYPSRKVYTAPTSEAALSVAGEWKFKAEFEKDSEIRDPSFFDNSPTNKAQNAILADLLRTIQRNYKDYPIQLRFSQDSTSFRFQIWDYNPRALIYTPPPPPLPDTVITYDVVNIIREEKFVETDTTFYDVIYIFQSMADTLFIPEEPQKIAQQTQINEKEKNGKN
jgi:hypothetical protein